MSSHASARELEQYVGGTLSAGECTLLESHLAECEECQLRLAGAALQTPWAGEEHRSEPRIAVKFQARLKLLDPVTSASPPHVVQVVEISRSGLKVRTPRNLLPKTLVQVRFNGKAVLGEVRYCDKMDGAFYAGIRRVPDFPSE
jgi:hypothetical protein